jgi:aspartyl aminopeptidase
LGEAVKRISSALIPDSFASGSLVDMYEATIRKSFVLSSDQAHALHPNYASKHEKNHQPQMNAGMVIKRNANQRYATNGITGVLIREIARRASLKPVQEFIVRQDCGCGSTIGPLISAATGMRAIDMGCPQLSMHSIRETMGTCDCK